MSYNDPLLSVDDLADQVAEVLDYFGRGVVMCTGVTIGAYVLTLFAMDRNTWMYEISRASKRYLASLLDFLKVAEDDRKNKGKSHIWCPCEKCQNCHKFNDFAIIQEHLICEGFMSGYTRWSRHGELLIDHDTVVPKCSHDEAGDYLDSESCDGLDDMLHDLEDNVAEKDHQKFQQLFEDKVDLEIEFDELGKNIGATQSHFSNYCGVMVRTRISIVILRWDEVPKAEIDELWLNIKKHWNIEDDRHKKQVLKICNQSWKAYKSSLVTEYLKKGRNPVPEYPYLDEPTWNAFVQLKTSPSFQEISSKATETAKLNKYPPRIGPRGYRGMKPQWEKEMESCESTKFHNIRSERARNFILARLKRDPTGIYSLPTDLYSLASELIEKDTQLSHGDWFPGPGADVLTEVLGPEHPGGLQGQAHPSSTRQANRHDTVHGTPPNGGDELHT
ncbi:unnamed protein product [Lactuca virosa]|uniref:Transposase-associated domain-containing protein n=1 Tax=Lactuca virosa TaxID=75947 RepID=A0AAU9MZ79_9ASTR|nr:unnamed protein product [Lactuca virosa]